MPINKILVYSSNMPDIIQNNLELQMLLNIKESGVSYRQRREDQWTENYELYRDTVKINRLLQRQSVNIPLMKTALRTILKDVDQRPVIEFQELDNDKEKEAFLNEYWKWTLELNNADIQDIVDKKQDFFFGRTFDTWQVEDGKVVFDIEDPYDIIVERFMNPYDIDSSRSLVHQHIFVPLSSLKNNPDYDKKAVAELEDFFKTQLGIVKAVDNENSLQKKNEKLADLGVPDTEDPVLGETYVELTMYKVYRPAGEKWKDNNDGKTYTEDEEQIFVYIEAEQQNILMKKPQEKIIGVTSDHFWRNHYNTNTWGDDIDNQDFWTDGLADIVRPNNKVLNAFYSQLVENRTLRNLGMHFYDASIKADGFEPGTYEPRAFGFYPIYTGGKPISEVFQKVDIPDLSESIDEMEYITSMVEKATGATATQQGAISANQRTLGEVELAQNEAKSRVKGMSKFYTKAWEQRATKFLKLIEAAADKLDAVKIYKEGKNTTDLYGREISPKDWKSEVGYKVKVWSQDEKKANDTDQINKINIALAYMPDNLKLKEIQQRKLLEVAGLKPDEISAIMEVEKAKAQALLTSGLIQPPTPGQPNQPTQPGLQPDLSKMPAMQ